MYTLYGRPGSGSGACEAMLALAGAPHEIVDLLKRPDGSLPDDIFRVNPLGQVPVLTLPDGTTMTESAAICLYLADMFPEVGLAPASGDPDRAAYLRWMVYLAANIYMTDLRFFYPDRYTTEEAGASGVQEAAALRVAVEWTVFAEGLGDKPFILGSRLSAADIYAAMLVSWVEPLDAFFAQHPNLAAHYRRVAAVPVIADVWRRHGMPI